MTRNILILAWHDLATALQNKTLYLILFIPVFVFVALQLVDASEASGQTLDIGLLEQQHYPPAMVERLQSASPAVTVSWFDDETQARHWLQERQGDGILVPLAAGAAATTLIVPDAASLQTVAIVESISALQRAEEGWRTGWIAQIRPLRESGLQLQMLPTWILMLVLMVGFIVLPAQVAEEKEKKLLLALLQTPIHEVEWLLAKVCFGITLILVAATLLHLLALQDMDAGSAAEYLVFLLAGGFCFSALGVLVGFLCRTQASARTLGVLFYVPLLLPSALADFSRPLHSIAPWIPSYQLYKPVKSILLEGGGVSDFPLDLLALLAVGGVATFLSYQLMKRRWLMQ